MADTTTSADTKWLKENMQQLMDNQAVMKEQLDSRKHQPVKMLLIICCIFSLSHSAFVLLLVSAMLVSVMFAGLLEVALVIDVYKAILLAFP